MWLSHHRSEIIVAFMKQVTVDEFTGCWMWSSKNGLLPPHQYGLYTMNGKQYLAHRAAYEIFIGEIPDGEGYHGICACHKCDTPPCVNPDHLFLGTQQDNMDDMMKKGRRHNQNKQLVDIIP